MSECFKAPSLECFRFDEQVESKSLVLSVVLA